MEWETILLGVIFTLIVLVVLWLIVNGMLERAGGVAGTLFVPYKSRNQYKNRKKGEMPYSMVSRIVLIVIAVIIMFLLLATLLGGAGKPLSSIFYDLFGAIV